MEQINQLELDGWQTLLDRNAALFLGMQVGARIGVLSKDDFEPPAMMVVWEVTAHGMLARYKPFGGFEQVQVDLLFIADEPTIQRMHNPCAADPFKEIRTKLRRRDILLYVVKPHRALLDSGYEPFLDLLGLPVLGTCR